MAQCRSSPVLQRGNIQVGLVGGACAYCTTVIDEYNNFTVEPGILVMFLFWGMILVDLGGIRGTTDDYDQNTLYGVLKEFIHYCFFLDCVH